MSSFMRGYQREPEVTEKLIAAIRNALYAKPEQRLGQLLMNTAPSDGYGQMDLFNVYDEEMIERLQNAAIT